MRHWSGMLVQSGGSKPFVVSLMGILADEFPYIIFKMGGFVDRDIRGKPGVKSAHASGRAIDIYLDARQPQEKALGKLLYRMFKDNAASMGTEHVIFDGLVWSTGNAADSSTHDAGVRDIHDDHVHVDFATTGIDGNAGHLVAPIHSLRRLMKLQSYHEWVEGYYGPAFNPTSHNTRLTATEREAIYWMNSENCYWISEADNFSMKIGKKYDLAMAKALKWRAQGKIPDPSIIGRT